ncbi:MAG TPA: DUF362 domain-containing protein [Methanothermobacter sp.]|nr:conserved hypothetical protein [Methanothermobacter sp. MT-2]HHW04910.1 DUF362 domain-containing protein [Methanothermobacter sp.]HOK73269.1 DUF362 domain-containing protein [Methanothermobacter sp.]HOL69562.1 DUF362 domain-containing protein [Methanothermobacter sp.]HPQ05133.1 DUF362 domain-containing protein [Methanothermobacter sp.]
MVSKVYFADLRARSADENKGNKIMKLFDEAADGMFSEDDVVAVKVHFGERGNDSFVSPVLLRYIVDKVKERTRKVFLTDTNTLYYGSRHDSVDHIVTAILNGFDYAVVGAPVIIADGLHGGNERLVEVDQKHFDVVKIAGDIYDASGMVVVSHFKGHGMSGFGGALKNLAMGCATIDGKLEQHECAKPIIEGDCNICGVCVDGCPVGALRLGEEGVEIDYDLCIACMNCMDSCPNEVYDLNWEEDVPIFIERMMEYSLGAVKGKEGKLLYFNFLTNVTPDCDCVPWSDYPIVPDIGILASEDPVAIDSASYDLVNRQIGLMDSILEKNFEFGADKFRGVWEMVDSSYQLVYAEEIGLGSRDYRLVKVLF